MGWFSRLRARYGRKGHAHTFARESAITRNRRDGLVDVILVDGKGTYLKTLATGVKPSLGELIVRKRHP